MLIFALLIAAFLGPSARAAERPPEETLRAKLGAIRQQHLRTERQAVLGSGARLRDGVAAQRGSENPPGLPQDRCRDLASCTEAPVSLHVEDNALLDEAFVSAARPWLKLQEARGRSVAITVDPGVGVRLALEDFAAMPVVTLEAEPSPMSGFDVVLREGPAAAQVYSRERAALQAP